MSLLVVMGSGETAPAMRRVHREVFAATGAGPAVLLDTPFGFQENADELTARTRAYFRDSVGREVGVAPWRSSDAPVADQEAALAALASARWVFAGPGSPTYALRHWAGTPVPDLLVDVVGRGGTLVLGSAAAVTIGPHAIPIYEIYKVGEPVRWVAGLDLLGRLAGLRAAVVPHYDNAEGGSHDTRFCYLGERRLAVLEAALPDDVGILGVDEHTALVLDLSAGTGRVLGLGGVTVRRRGTSTVVATGQEFALPELASLLAGAGPAAARRPPPGPAVVEAVPASLRHETERARAAFDDGLAAGDVDGCVAAALALEQAIADWAADTLQGDDRERARRALRLMLLRLGERARVGARDPRSLVAPVVDLVLDLRRRARDDRDFGTSDLVRDRLAGAGIEVRDTPAGAEWTLQG